jgi:hypothetical protein
MGRKTIWSLLQGTWALIPRNSTLLYLIMLLQPLFIHYVVILIMGHIDASLLKSFSALCHIKIYLFVCLRFLQCLKYWRLKSLGSFKLIMML